MLNVVAVGMLDWQTLGRDTFFVQTGEDEVWLYEANKNGQVKAVIDEGAPLRYVTASIEKFNNMYRLEEPLPIDELAELCGLLGRFEITSKTSCRYLG